MSQRLKDSYLAESYNERTRRGQAYQADASQYENEYARKTVQNIIDSGVANNTNRTHELVDMMAKISADKQIIFTAADAKKLKETGYGLKDATVNGYFDGETITVNINSSKALNSIVGHEIAHALEGTELYTALRDAVTQYAKTSGKYDSHLAALRKIYEGKKGYDTDFDAKVEQELVADLIGDYVFSDGDFVRSLSTKNRNLFQRIYDEIKYLLKVSTAGSKEARQLEKVKKIFDEAYREKNTAQPDGVKYLLSDGTTKNASELSRNDLQYLLEAAQNGELSDNSFIPLRRNTPEFFIGVVKEHSKDSVVVENHPMAATVAHLRQNMDEEDGQSYGSTRPHGFSVDDIITMSEKMSDPSYIVLQKNGRYAEVVSFYNKRNKQVVVAIDFADSSSTKTKNYKYSQYMNGYGDGYYNIIVTQYEPDDLTKYLKDNEIVYSKKEMNGRYQVGSGRIVTVTHDTPFIDDIIGYEKQNVNVKLSISENGREAPYSGENVYGSEVAVESREMARQDDQNTFVSRRAQELYQELSDQKKGIRASYALSYLLDYGYDWRSIKIALLNIRDNPEQTVNPNSAIESIAREMLTSEYTGGNEPQIGNNVYWQDVAIEDLHRSLDEIRKGNAQQSEDGIAMLIRGLEAIRKGNANQTVPQASTTENRAKAEKIVGDRNAVISQRAAELYEESVNLKKGVRASKTLGYIIDHGYGKQSVRTALLNIRDNPDQMVNPNSMAEQTIRKMLNDAYDNDLYDAQQLLSYAP